MFGDPFPCHHNTLVRESFTETLYACRACSQKFRMSRRTIFDAVQPVQTAARNTDPDTSKMAAAIVTAKESSTRVRLLHAYGGGATITDEQAAYRAGIQKGCWWKRCSELRQMGLIADTGERYNGAAGTPRMACRITAAGMDVLNRRKELI